jgi:GNAT superfamily N-acetyltransferase
MLIIRGRGYIANMFTLSKFRRQGLARAVLSTLLASAAGRGARRSLLISSQAGMALYHGMGYQDFLSCLVFDVSLSEF